MSMHTIIKSKDGKTHTFRTEQYISGLYMIINDDPSQQMVVNSNDEYCFHRDLRKKAKEMGDDTFVGGTKLPVETKANERRNNGTRKTGKAV